MLELRDLLHLDGMTVSGRTVGENLERVRQTGFLTETRRYLNNYKIGWRDVIFPRERPFKPSGAIAVLRGNLAPEGAVTKQSAVPPEMWLHTGPARPFDSEEAAIEALLHAGEADHDGIQPGDVVIIRYEGPRGSGMPEMMRCTDLIAANPTLAATTALVTDGRFSGATRGPAVGHVSPVATGGASGIGRACVTALAAEGARVVVADRAVAQGEATVAEVRAAGGEALFVPTDVTVDKDAERLADATVERYGGIDVLVNNAGIQTYDTVIDTPREDWDRTLVANLTNVSP